MEDVLRFVHLHFFCYEDQQLLLSFCAGQHHLHFPLLGQADINSHHFDQIKLHQSSALPLYMSPITCPPIHPNALLTPPCHRNRRPLPPQRSPDPHQHSTDTHSPPRPRFGLLQGLTDASCSGAELWCTSSLLLLLLLQLLVRCPPSRFPKDPFSSKKTPYGNKERPVQLTTLLTLYRPNASNSPSPAPAARSSTQHSCATTTPSTARWGAVRS